MRPSTGLSSMREKRGHVTPPGFSITVLRPGYDRKEVGAFLEAIRDTFAGVTETPLTADAVRNKKFATTGLRPVTTRRRSTPSSTRSKRGCWSDAQSAGHCLLSPLGPAPSAGPLRREALVGSRPQRRNDLDQWQPDNSTVDMPLLRYSAHQVPEPD